jgi:hypothetical protein
MSDIDNIDTVPAATSPPDTEWRLLHAQCPICDHVGILSNRLAPEHRVVCSHCGARAPMSVVAAGMVGMSRQTKSCTRPRRRVEPVAE